MSNAISPRLVRAMLVIGKILNDPVVDLVEEDLSVDFAQNSHRDEGNVRVRRSIDVRQASSTAQSRHRLELMLLQVNVARAIVLLLLLGLAFGLGRGSR